MQQVEQYQSKPVAVPGRLGQGTAVEQSRAVAEVQAAIVVAQQCPRNIQAAMAEMRTSCTQLFLAEKAFYRFPRAGQTVSGPSVHLARELARCWGNLQYGLVEMRRDDDYAQSEMQAFAWDVEKNSRNSSTFIVPHLRDTKQGPKKLTDTRDIYELNTNNGARRVREAIFAILPPWFVEEAKQICMQTLQSGGGEKPLAQQIADALARFSGELGVSEQRITGKYGPIVNWTTHEVAQLRIIYRSLKNGEVTVEQEFPTAAVSGADFAPAPAKAPAPAAKKAEPAAEVPAAGAAPVTIWDRIDAARVEKGWSQEQTEVEFANWSGGEEIGTVADAQLESFIAFMAGAA
ncbi:hypothetical protein [Streptacidiphilus carbonis]|uniref:hypothetical protein n=1 Tax=Streptacidiphilus carbonis TaxID=105422 RepID=UPI000AAE8BA0|nr:hypothetical protein [Streptacidiphilus carbonis]